MDFDNDSRLNNAIKYINCVENKIKIQIEDGLCYWLTTRQFIPIIWAWIACY